ncbi:MAG: hypothetical protein L6V93_01130 [Clostridiales bacterium]|nr:MAG: hypothetical protein L6V93_01130 [Clostridiales bacterium]
MSICLFDVIQKRSFGRFLRVRKMKKTSYKSCRKKSLTPETDRFLR